MVKTQRVKILVISKKPIYFEKITDLLAFETHFGQEIKEICFSTDWQRCLFSTKKFFICVDFGQTVEVDDHALGAIKSGRSDITMEASIGSDSKMITSNLWKYYTNYITFQIHSSLTNEPSPCPENLTALASKELMLRRSLEQIIKICAPGNWKQQIKDHTSFVVSVEFSEKVLIDRITPCLAATFDPFAQKANSTLDTANMIEEKPSPSPNSNKKIKGGLGINMLQNKSQPEEENKAEKIRRSSEYSEDEKQPQKSNSALQRQQIDTLLDSNTIKPEKRKTRTEAGKVNELSSKTIMNEKMVEEDQQNNAVATLSESVLSPANSPSQSMNKDNKIKDLGETPNPVPKGQMYSHSKEPYSKSSESIPENGASSQFQCDGNEVAEKRNASQSTNKVFATSIKPEVSEEASAVSNINSNPSSSAVKPLFQEKENMLVEQECGNNQKKSSSDSLNGSSHENGGEIEKNKSAISSPINLGNRSTDIDKAPRGNDMVDHNEFGTTRFNSTCQPDGYELDEAAEDDVQNTLMPLQPEEMKLWGVIHAHTKGAVQQIKELQRCLDEKDSEFSRIEEESGELVETIKQHNEDIAYWEEKEATQRLESEEHVRKKETLKGEIENLKETLKAMKIELINFSASREAHHGTNELQEPDLQKKTNESQESKGYFDESQTCKEENDNQGQVIDDPTEDTHRKNQIVIDTSVERVLCQFIEKIFKLKSEVDGGKLKFLDSDSPFSDYSKLESKTLISSSKSLSKQYYEILEQFEVNEKTTCAGQASSGHSQMIDGPTEDTCRKKQHVFDSSLEMILCQFIEKIFKVKSQIEGGKIKFLDSDSPFSDYFKLDSAKILIPSRNSLREQYSEMLEQFTVSRKER